MDEVGVSNRLAEGMLSSPAPPPEWGSTTTVMMRNLPNKYTQRMLLVEINEAGFLGTYDFLYLPIDPETSANRGYCFLNFIDPNTAWIFKLSYEGRSMSRFNSNKVVSVVPATLQGFEANYAHYASARVNRGDPAARPLFLRQPSQATTGNSWPGNPRRRGGNRGERESGGAEHAALQQDYAMPQQQQQQLYLGLDERGFEEAVPYPQGGSWGGIFHPGMGQQMATAVAAVAPPDEGRQVVPRFCPQCGGQIQIGFQFCPRCGASLEALRLAVGS